MKANHLYNTYVLTIYRYLLIFAAQLLYVVAAFMPVLQALVDVGKEYYDFLATETAKIAAFLRAWYPEAVKFRAEVVEDCKKSLAVSYMMNH